MQENITFVICSNLNPIMMECVFCGSTLTTTCKYCQTTWCSNPRCLENIPHKFCSKYKFQRFQMWVEYATKLKKNKIRDESIRLKKNRTDGNNIRLNFSCNQYIGDVTPQNLIAPFPSFYDYYCAVCLNKIGSPCSKETLTLFYDESMTCLHYYRCRQCTIYDLKLHPITLMSPMESATEIMLCLRKKLPKDITTLIGKTVLFSPDIKSNHACQTFCFQ